MLSTVGGFSCRRQRCSEQLEQVVGGGHQRPLPIHLLQHSQPEVIKTPGPLGFDEHRLDDRLAQGIDGLAGFGAKFAILPPQFR